MQRTPELEPRQQSCVACRFFHEVQYHTMGNISAVVAATAEEQVSPNHPRCVYHLTAVQQSTAEKPIHQQPTIPTCVYNKSTYSSTTAEQKAKTQRRGDSTDALSRMERSTVEPTENVVITCCLRESSFEKSSLAEFGCDALSVAGDREGCCVGGTWRRRAVSVDRVAPWSSRC